LLEIWQLERDVCERVARQFRCVSDGCLAVFGSSAARSSPCAGTIRLRSEPEKLASTELDAVEQVYSRMASS
jgi:hypothetical protein